MIVKYQWALSATFALTIFLAVDQWKVVTNMAPFMPFSSDFGDCMTTQSMGLMVLLSEYF